MLTPPLEPVAVCRGHTVSAGPDITSLLECSRTRCWTDSNLAGSAIDVRNECAPSSVTIENERPEPAPFAFFGSRAQIPRAHARGLPRLQRELFRVRQDRGGRHPRFAEDKRAAIDRGSGVQVESVRMVPRATQWSLKWSYEGFSKGVTFGCFWVTTWSVFRTTLRPR